MRLMQAAMLLGFAAIACADLREFEGQWEGAIVAEPGIREGFDDEVRVAPLTLEEVSLRGIEARLTTTDGRFSDTPLALVQKAANDSLATLTFDGGPLHTFLLFAPISGGLDDRNALVVVSMFANQGIELRVLRDNELYGLFLLRRAE